MRPIIQPRTWAALTGEPLPEPVPTAPRVLLSPRGMVAVQLSERAYMVLTSQGGRVDQLVYLDPDEVADWREYVAPDG